MTGNAVCISAGPPHASLLARLHYSCFDEGERWGEEAFSGLLTTSGTLAWIALVGETPAGLLMLRHSLDEAEILTLGVNSQYRRQNLASSLLDTGYTALRELGVTTLFLEVSVRNKAAIALYLKQGFTLCGRRKTYYADGSDASVLRYDLTSVTR